MISKQKIKFLKAMKRAFFKEFEHIRSPRRREVISTGLEALDELLDLIENERNDPDYKIPMKMRIKKILEDYPGAMEQADLAHKIRVRWSKYRRDPSFVGKLDTTLRRLRKRKTLWLGAKNIRGVWYYTLKPVDFY